MNRRIIISILVILLLFVGLMFFFSNAFEVIKIDIKESPFVFLEGPLELFEYEEKFIFEDDSEYYCEGVNGIDNLSRSNYHYDNYPLLF